jgi:hypothetical protein
LKNHIKTGFYRISAQIQDDFNSYKNLKMELQLEGKANIHYNSGRNSLESLKIDLKYIPKDNFMQETELFEVSSDPLGKVTRENVLKMRWENVNDKEITFGYYANINNENLFLPVNEKVNFPLRNVDSQFLKYTGASEFIDLNEDIENLARTLASGEDDMYQVVYNIADWTRNNIEYDLNTLTAEAVQPSSWVLKNKQGVCDELTNLFISILRSVGIPARFVSGMVYTNLDGAWGTHGWAEVYFPEYGWVPWDVTYAQYGWVDPTHIRLQESLDSGESSIEYLWNSKGVEGIIFDNLDVNARLISSDGAIESPVEINSRVLYDKVGIGSYIPLEVSVENKKNYYVSLNLIVTKAPGVEGSNLKSILLKPKEAKSIYWILHSNAEMQEGYLYTSTVEVTDTFKDTTSSVIQFNDKHDFYSKEEVEALLKSLTNRNKKEILEELRLECSTDKDVYYTGENAMIDCKVFNMGIKRLDLNICLIDFCNKISLEPNEKRDVYFKFELMSKGRLSVSAEDKERVKYEYINLNVVEIPKVFVSSVEPDKIKYGEKANLKLIIYSNNKIKDVKLKTKFGNINIDEMKGEREIEIDVASRYLVYPFDVEFSYKDENDREYEHEEPVYVEVLNVPWYSRFFAWIASWVT